jgi:hypothetical protein
MSSRSIRKVRHFRQAPSFKERSQAGVLKQTAQLWTKYGWGEAAQPVVAEPVLEVHEHSHGPDCHHE